MDLNKRTPLTDHQAKYLAYELTRRWSSDSMGKLAAAVAGAQVDLNPHQVDADLKLGGSGGKKVEQREGDLILLPTGTAHRMIASSSDFRVVSAFPEGQENEESVDLEAVEAVSSG